MWPVVLGVGIAAVGLASWLSSSKESSSKEYKYWKYCVICGKELENARKPETPGYFMFTCPECRELDISQVEVFPETYKGNKYRPCADKQTIHTTYFVRRDPALDELKRKAVKLDCNVVYDVTWKRYQYEIGNYVQSLWSATGMAAQRPPSA